MMEQGMTKGNRPRYLEVPEKTMQLLKDIKEQNLHSDENERIFGSRMTENDVRYFMKECSRLGKRRYSGVHDFRRSMVEYRTREMQKMEKQLKNKELAKEKLVDLIMAAVGADERLNPMIKVYPPVLDENGKQVYAKRKNGSRYPLFDKFKPPEIKRKYIKEELMKKRIDYIKDVRISLLLGHNRPDISSVYKPIKKK
jgi:integrase